MVVITKSKNYSKAHDEIEEILIIQIFTFAIEQSIPYELITDSKAIQESIETIADKFGDFVDYVKKNKDMTK